MGRKVIPLNDTFIKELKPFKKPVKENSEYKKEKNKIITEETAKDYVVADGNGLQLLIKTNGTKLWEFYYTREATQKRAKTSLGIYPKVSLANARKKRTEYFELICNGIDPIKHFRSIKQKAKEQELNKYNTIQKVLDNFYQYRKDNNEIQELTIEKDKRRVENHFISKLPKKENTHITDITFEEIIKVLKKIENENKLSTLTKVRSILIRVFKYAYAQSIIHDVTIFGKLELFNFKKDTEIKNNPTLTTKEDIKKLYIDILSYENSIITRYLLLFTIHTAQRQGSIITAKWCDINLDEKLWTIPKENMKGTLKKKKTHYLPLSDITIKFLKELYEFTGDSDYLFPNSQINKTRNKYPHISNNTVTKALRLMGYTNQQTAHGFRAMFKTVCKEHQESDKLSNEFVERVLSHKVDGEVEGAYNRASNIEDMRKVVNWWSEYLENLITN